MYLYYVEQDKSHSPRIHSGSERGNNWLGKQGQIKQEKCFGGMAVTTLPSIVLDHHTLVNYYLLDALLVYLFIQLKSRNGAEYLIQYDTESIITDWYKVIVDTINQLVSLASS